MKTKLNRLLMAFAFVIAMFYGCAKNSDYDQTDPVTPHVYGVLPTTPEMIAGLPVYPNDQISSLRTERATFPASLRLETPSVRNQGQIGSCTAFCGAETDEILYYYKNNHSWPNIMSPAFVYYCERVLIMKQKISSDNGAPMVDIPRALIKYGDCLEPSYPYPSSDRSTSYITPPSSAAIAQALSYPASSYGLVAAGNIDAVKSLLASNVPVMMGFNVYDNSSYTLFERLKGSNSTYNPLTSTGSLVQGARLLGGHATPIIGYDDNHTGGGAFLVMNSWGSSWGEAGFFWMPYTVFKNTTIVPSNNCYWTILL